MCWTKFICRDEIQLGAATILLEMVAVELIDSSGRRLIIYSLDVQGGTAGSEVGSILRHLGLHDNRGIVAGDVILFAISPQRISFLAMLRVVSNQQMLLRHAQGCHQPDDQQYERCCNHVPGCDEAGATDLFHDLDASAAAVECPIGVRHRYLHEVAQRWLREQAHADAPQDAAYSVRVDYPQGVVHLLEHPPTLVQHHHRPPWNAPS